MTSKNGTVTDGQVLPGPYVAKTSLKKLFVKKLLLECHTVYDKFLLNNNSSKFVNLTHSSSFISITVPVDISRFVLMRCQISSSKGSMIPSRGSWISASYCTFVKLCVPVMSIPFSFRNKSRSIKVFAEICCFKARFLTFVIEIAPVVKARTGRLDLL